MLELIFWLSGAVVAYVYVGYPLLLKLAHLAFGRAPSHPPAVEPPVTLVISAFNEEASIREKLENTLQLDYPADRLQVLVVSDASDDRTDDIVREFAGRGVRLLRMAERGGKTVGLNAAIREASGDVVVFSDANAMYRRDALRRLSAPFADRTVGAVVGESTYHDSETASEASESLYWKYETAIKRLESETGSVVGGDGAIYAIRRGLYVPMRADALSDFVNPLQIVKSGHRCLYEPAAQSVEKAAEGFDREFRRKVRIVNRAWRAMLEHAGAAESLPPRLLRREADLPQAAALAGAGVSRGTAGDQPCTARPGTALRGVSRGAARLLRAGADGARPAASRAHAAAPERAVLFHDGEHRQCPRHPRRVQGRDLHDVDHRARAERPLTSSIGNHVIRSR